MPGVEKRKISSDGVNEKSKRRSFSSRKSLIFIMLLIIIIAIFSGIKIIENRQKINLARIDYLTNTNNCTAASINSVSGEKANFSKHPEASIKLITYRAVCDIYNQKFSQSNYQYAQLKTYYSSKDNKQSLAIINQEISSNNYAIKHPIKPISAADKANLLKSVNQ